MIAAERTHIRLDCFAAALGGAMMERFIVVEVGIPGRDITMQPLAAARDDPQPLIEYCTWPVDVCRRRHRFGGDISGYADLSNDGVLCDVAGMLSADHSIPVQVGGLAATVQSRISHHNVDHGATNDNSTPTILWAISTVTVTRQER